LKIRAILRKDNCVDAIDGRPTYITDEKWKEMDDNIWDTLIKLYEVKSLHNIIFLKRTLYTF